MATLDSLEFNWPIIPGSFSTPQECVAAYIDFHHEHRYHADPVCFRAALFAGALGYWCRQYKFAFDVNKVNAPNAKFLILSKLLHLPARVIQILELMCLTGFIMNPKSSMTDEYSQVTRYRPCQDLRNLRPIASPTIIQPPVLRRSPERS